MSAPIAPALGMLTVGGLLIASGLTGTSVVDLLGDAVRATLNPAGGIRHFDTPAAALDASTAGAAEGAVTAGDARALVDRAVALARTAGGGGIYVASGYRPGSTVGGGGASDHSGNDANRAARDIAVRGVNALSGPPMPELDRAVVAIGRAFGRDYKAGQTIIDTFTHGGLRVQVLWRTPLYGDHRGHIHVGARKA